MKSFRYMPLAPALACLMVAPLLAQERGEATGERAQQAEDVLRFPTYVKATIGAGAVVGNESERRLGIVRDHVIDSQSGKVLYVAVATGEREGQPAKLVPYERFTWNAEAKRLVLPMTPEALAALPEYDPENLPPIGGHRVAEHDGDASTPEGDAPERGGPEAHAREAGAPVEHLSLASTGTLGSEIFALRERFGSVRELILEPKQGAIAFVLATGEATGGDPYIVPWQAMAWQAPQHEGSEGRFTFERTKADLEAAPTLAGGELARLKDRETLASIYTFYDLAAPSPPAGKAVRTDRN